MRFFDELRYIKYELGIGKILIAIILIHILIILANLIIVNQTIKSIKNDAILINSGGMIRGGIQRVVKLTLEDKLNQDEIMKIEAIKVNPNQKELTPRQKVVAQKILKAIQKRNQKQQAEMLKG